MCPEAAASIARQKLAAMGIVLLSACTSQQRALAPTVGELACYNQADADAQEMVDLLCPAVPFVECPQHDAIMQKLEQAQKECRGK